MSRRFLAVGATRFFFFGLPLFLLLPQPNTNVQKQLVFSYYLFYFTATVLTYKLEWTVLYYRHVDPCRVRLDQVAQKEGTK